MPTIAEIIAARKAKETAAATGQPEADSTTGTPVSAPGKSSFRSLVLRANEAADDAPKNDLDQGYPPKWLTERRSLSETMGEGFPLTPQTTDPETLSWYAALQAFESELCAMRHPLDPEALWLAIRHSDKPEMPPILIHRLPWLLYEHPASVTEDVPY